MQKNIKILIKEDTITEDNKNAEELKKTLAARVNFVQNVRQGNLSSFLNSPGEAYDRIKKELSEKTKKYVYIVGFLAIISQVFYRLLLKPTGKTAVDIIRATFRWAQAKSSIFQRMPLSVEDAALTNSVKNIGKNFNTIAAADLDIKGVPGGKSLLRQAGQAYQDSSLPKWIRGSKVLTTVVGAGVYIATTGNDEDEKGKQDKAVDQEFDITDYYTELLSDSLILFTKLDIILFKTKIKPFIDSDDNLAAYVIYSSAIPLGGAGVALLKVAASIINNKKKVPSYRMIKKMFDNAMSESFKVGAGQVSTILERGMTKGIEDVFKKIESSPLNQTMTDLKLTGADGGFNLKQRILTAFKETIDQGKDIRAEFNQISIDARKFILEQEAIPQSRRQDAADIINQIMVRVYSGALRGYDKSVTIVARNGERAARRGRLESADTMADIKTVFTPDRKGNGLADVSDTIAKRRSQYSEEVRKLMFDWKSLDEDFMSFWYLSGGKQLPTNWSGSSLRKGGPDSNAFLELRKAQEDILKNYNNKIENLNAAVRDDLKTIAGLTDGVPTKSISFAKFKDVDEVRRFIDDVFNETAQGVEKSLKNLNDSSKQVEDVHVDLEKALNKYDDLTDFHAASKDVVTKNFDHLEDMSTEDAVANALNQILNSKQEKEILQNAAKDILSSKSYKEYQAGIRGKLDKATDFAFSHKFISVVSIVVSAYALKSAYFDFIGREGEGEEGISTSVSNTITGISDEEALQDILMLLSISLKSDQNYSKLPSTDKKKTNTIWRNFQSIARDSGHFNLIRSSLAETGLSKEILRIKRSKKGEENYTRKDFQQLKKFMEDNTANMFSGESALTKIMNKSSSRNIAFKESKSEQERNQALSKVLVLLAFGGLEDENNKVKAFFENSDKIPEQYRGDDEKISQWCVKTRRDNRMMKKAVLKKWEELFIKEPEKVEEKITKANLNYISNIVRETLLEYRQLDKYSKYPYHSEVGSNEEEQKDFMEDWKDFELSLVRDESRETAIELAKMLVKDLELFGDVVDLVGKNQSVGTEILKKFKKKK